MVYNALLTAFLTFAIFTSYTEKNEPPLAAGTYLTQQIKSVDLNRQFDFSGELLPMENFDVQQRLDRELLINAYTHSTTLMNIKKANAMFPAIEHILAENGVPDDFKYLAVAESNLGNGAVSRTGAKGIWQFMEGTAKEFDLEVNDEIDERMNLEKATVAACAFIKQLKDRYGSWTMAAAAYNMGAGGLNRDVNSQKNSTYYDLNLNSETSRYVFRIVAIKDILQHPEAYGFFVDNDHLYAPLDDYVSLQVDGPIPSWADFAISNGVTYRMLKLYNPWITGSSLTNKAKKTYLVRIPKKG